MVSFVQDARALFGISSHLSQIPPSPYFLVSYLRPSTSPPLPSLRWVNVSLAPNPPTFSSRIGRRRHMHLFKIQGNTCVIIKFLPSLSTSRSCTTSTPSTIVVTPPCHLPLAPPLVDRRVPDDPVEGFRTHDLSVYMRSYTEIPRLWNHARCPSTALPETTSGSSYLSVFNFPSGLVGLFVSLVLMSWMFFFFSSHAVISTISFPLTRLLQL